MRNVRTADLGLIALLLIVGHAVRVVRWASMIRYLGAPIRTRSCVAPYLIGVSLNNVAPLRAGDVYRVFAFGRRSDLGRTQLLGTIVMERVLDFALLLIFLAGGLISLPDAELRTRLAMWLLVTVAIGAGTAAALIVARRRIGSSASIAKPGGVAARLFGYTTSLIESLEAILLQLRAPARLLYLAGLSLTAWTITATIFLVVAHAFELQGPAIASFFATAAANLAGLLPSSPGSIGTFHYFAAWAFAAYAVSWDVAAALALTIHAVFWLPLTFMGLALVGLRHARSRGRALKALTKAVLRARQT